MITGTPPPVHYDDVKKLKERLPNIPDSVIAHFLTQRCNGDVDRCYQYLSGSEQRDVYIEASLADQSHFGQHPPGPAQTPVRGISETSQDSPWMTGTPPTNEFPHGHVGPTPPSGPAPPHQIQRMRTTLVDAQRRQLGELKGHLEQFGVEIHEMRSRMHIAKQELSSMRQSASSVDPPQDTRTVLEIIETLKYDVASLKRKIEVQASIRGPDDIYTEDGVRWTCKNCSFVNHPLMTHCERCPMPSSSVPLAVTMPSNAVPHINSTT